MSSKIIDNRISKAQSILRLCCDSYTNLERAIKQAETTFKAAKVTPELNAVFSVTFISSGIHSKETFKLTRNKRGLYQWKPITLDAIAVIKEHIG